MIRNGDNRIMRGRKKSGLNTYRAKRRFGVTAEPKGKVARKRGNAFVIQKHAARRLHYDLRLELDGVMKSWAVTRGPSLVPGEKRLAVQVEDHPIAYNKFEGTIPQGEYGGGTVMIWDRGHWEPENDAHKGLAKGHLAFGWMAKSSAAVGIVRMHRRRGEKRDNWLLIKQQDAPSARQKRRTYLRRSRLPSRPGAQWKRLPRDQKRMAQQSHAINESNEIFSARAYVRPQCARSASLQRATTSIYRPPRTPRSPLLSRRAWQRLPTSRPTAITGCMKSSSTVTASRPDLDRGKVKLLTRKGLDWTDKFPTIAAAIAKLPASTALIDGEMVAEGSDGISSFSLLQQDLKASRHDRMAFYAFDLLHLDGADLKSLPLVTRKETLAALVNGRSGRETVQLERVP